MVTVGNGMPEVGRQLITIVDKKKMIQKYRNVGRNGKMEPRDLNPDPHSFGSASSSSAIYFKS